MAVYESKFLPEMGAGGFSRMDGTIAFFFRVQALLKPEMTVVDFGAGRGASVDLYADALIDVSNLRGRVAKVIGVDVDAAVLENTTIDEALVYDGVRIPLPDNSVDMIVSDHTIEHVPDADLIAREFERVLKPGGWVCARTPHLYSLLGFAANLVPNWAHKLVLRRAQPWRESRDIFPTAYKLNTLRALKRHFPTTRWEHCSHTQSPQPAYHFENGLIYWLMAVYQYLKYPVLGGEVLLVFMRKRGAAGSNPG